MNVLEQYWDMGAHATAVPEADAAAEGATMDADHAENPVSTDSVRDVREVSDKELHHMMWLADSAARVVKGAEPISSHHRHRMQVRPSATSLRS
eukprot:SAG31_NODE_3119_length_4656_cov_3.057055_6_plen_94_part_00